MIRCSKASGLIGIHVKRVILKMPFIHPLGPFITRVARFHLARYSGPVRGSSSLRRTSLPQHQTTAFSTTKLNLLPIQCLKANSTACDPSTYSHGITDPRASDARNNSPFHVSPHNTKLPNIPSKTYRCCPFASTKTSWCIQRRVSSIFTQ